MSLEMQTTLLNMNNLKLMETILKALREQLKESGQLHSVEEIAGPVPEIPLERKKKGKRRGEKKPPSSHPSSPKKKSKKKNEREESKSRRKGKKGGEWGSGYESKAGKQRTRKEKKAKNKNKEKHTHTKTDLGISVFWRIEFQHCAYPNPHVSL